MRHAFRFGGRALGVIVLLLLSAAPARAALLGGIEIGAKGVKATVIDATPGPHGLNVKVLLSGTYNTALSAGIAATGKFEAEALKATAAAIKKYVAEMEAKHKVPADSIYIVGSSGIFSPIASDARAVQARQEELARVIRTATGRKMDFISVRREAELSIVGIVPRALLDVSLLIDIGGGNTKGGFRDSSRKFVTFGVPYGSVTFCELIKKRSGKGDIVKSSASAAAEVLRPALRESIKAHSSLVDRERVYLSGGAAWSLATFTHPGNRAAYVELTAKDLHAYHRMLTARPGEYPKVDFASLGEEERKTAEKEIKRVESTYSPEQMLAGAEILLALASEFKLAEKKMQFPRNGYLGWILAYAALKQKGA
jgi:exopolyphosphatase/pppGpp-phosphohydrolase